MRFVTLSEVCEVVNGGTPKTELPEFWDGDILWITPRDLGKINSKRAYKTQRMLTASGIKNSSAKIIPQNSVIMSSRAPIGHVVINNMPMSFNQGCKGLIPKDNLEVNYLYYFLKLSKQRLNDLGTGTTFPELSNKALSNVTLPLPSIDEQRRIVSKLDKAFERLDKAIELTIKNIYNSQQLFANELSSIFQSEDSSWKRGRLDSFCILQRGHDLPKSDRIAGKYKLATSSGITDTHNVYKAIGPGVFTGRSGSIGGVFYEKENFWPLNTVLYVKEFYDNSPKLIYYLIKSLDFKKYAGGTGVPTLNRNDVHSIIVSIPKPNKQGSLVAKLDKLSDVSEKLDKLYMSKVLNLKALKQSMLQNAFTESAVE